MAVALPQSDSCFLMPYKLHLPSSPFLSLPCRLQVLLARDVTTLDGAAVNQV